MPRLKEKRCLFDFGVLRRDRDSKGRYQSFLLGRRPLEKMNRNTVLCEWQDFMSQQTNAVAAASAPTASFVSPQSKRMLRKAAEQGTKTQQTKYGGDGGVFPPKKMLPAAIVSCRVLFHGDTQSNTGFFRYTWKLVQILHTPNQRLFDSIADFFNDASISDKSSFHCFEDSRENSGNLVLIKAST